MSNRYYPRCVNQSTSISYKLQYVNETFPILNIDTDRGRPNRFDSKINIDVPFLLDYSSLEKCSKLFTKQEYDASPHKHVMWGFYRSYAYYCLDAIEILKLHLNSSDTSIFYPFIVRIGDTLTHSRTVPIISKFRMSAETVESFNQVTSFESSCLKDDQYRYLKVVTRAVDVNHDWDSYYWKSLPYYQPIVWNLNSERHFGRDLHRMRVKDIPWEMKSLGAKWMGNMNGGPPAPLPKEMSTLDICLVNARCRFVYQTRKSTLIDAKLYQSPYWATNDIVLDGYPLFGNRTSWEEMLKFKVVLSLEGNDVSSSLKWNLLSNSVVMMPPPTATSWLMEERLEPWVHYIPIKEDGSDAEEKMQWVGANDLEARRIAERGMLFMYDLLYHPDAKMEDILVKKEILRRYRQFWT